VLECAAASAPGWNVPCRFPLLSLQRSAAALARVVWSVYDEVAFSRVVWSVYDEVAFSRVVWSVYDEVVFGVECLVFGVWC
jgi:hypothetical protein